MQEDAWWNQECRWLKGTRHQAALAQGSDLAGGKRSSWQILKKRQKAMAGQGMGRAAGNEVVPVGMLEKMWGQLSLEIKEKKGVICG